MCHKKIKEEENNIFSAMVTLKNETMQSAAFYLQTKINRQLYPKSKYPLTHLLDQLSFEDFVSKQPTYVKHFKYTLIFLFVFTLLTTVFFQVHIYVFNSLFGPFHLNANEFVQHVKQFDKGQSWFYRIEYVQIEIGENNIQNPENSQSTIRKYSDPYTRRHHIATYKKMKQPNIYVKLPTTSQTNFHAQHRFHFPSYSIKTLKCIVKYLEQNSHIENQFFVEKSEYIKFINSEYAKNSSQFNKLILTKCGILIGYLYRPQFDKAFIPTREHNFYVNDIAFDATKQYCSYIPLIISMLIFSWLLCKSLFYLSIYLFNQIRKKLHFKIGLFSFPLNLPKNVVDELWLLNFEGQPHEQLRQLDEYLQQTSYQTEQNLFIIENDYQQLCVVLLRDKSGGNYHQLPFLICPVTDIKSIHYAGIVYGKDSSTIPWPFTINENDDHSDWLHAQLMDLSQHYRNMFDFDFEKICFLKLFCLDMNIVFDMKMNVRCRTISKEFVNDVQMNMGIQTKINNSTNVSLKKRIFNVLNLNVDRYSNNCVEWQLPHHQNLLQNFV